MNARNLLIGIGIVAVVTGGVLGSGALTQVSAERTATVNVADDSNAAVGLSVASNASSLVGSGTGSTLDLQFTSINQNATTTVTAFNVTNNLNSKAVGIQVGSDSSWLTLGNVNSTSSSYVKLSPGENQTVFVTIDTTSDSTFVGSSDSATITVTADTSAA